MIFKDLMDLVNKEKRQKEREKVAKYAIGMAAVAAAGVVVGLMVAPKSGKETRESLKKKAAEAEEIIKANLKKKDDVKKDATSKAAEDADNMEKDTHKETKGVKKEG
jgi:gas vesicle protein